MQKYTFLLLICVTQYSVAMQIAVRKPSQPSFDQMVTLIKSDHVKACETYIATKNPALLYSDGKTLLHIAVDEVFEGKCTDSNMISMLVDKYSLEQNIKNDLRTTIATKKIQTKRYATDQSFKEKVHAQLDPLLKLLTTNEGKHPLTSLVPSKDTQPTESVIDTKVNTSSDASAHTQLHTKRRAVDKNRLKITVAEFIETNKIKILTFSAVGVGLLWSLLMRDSALKKNRS